MKLSTFATEYVKHLGAYKGYSPRTCEGYQTTYGQFIAWLLGEGKTDDIREFTADNIEAFVRYLADAGIKPNSILVKLAGLSSLGRHATRTKDARGRYYLDSNPVDHVERPQKQRVDRPFFHRDELGKLMALDAPENEALARDLFAETQLRVSELCRVNVEDVWKDGQDRVILSTTVKGRGRREERVHVSLSSELGERIENYLLARNMPRGTEPLLVNREGRRYSRSCLSEMICRMGKKAGLERITARPHTIRHTVNVIARAESKLDVVTRAKLLNHSDTSTLQRYEHLIPGEDVAAREALRAGVRSYIRKADSVNSSRTLTRPSDP